MFGNILIALFFTRYLFFCISLTNKEHKQKIITKNERIEYLRNKDNKTLEEQKEFVKLKYNQEKPEKFSWKKLLTNTAPKIASTTGMFFFLNWIGLQTDFFLTLLVLVIVAMILNYFLRKKGLQNQDSIETIFMKR
jgi:Na+/melibiose symporter-like transporter